MKRTLIGGFLLLTGTLWSMIAYLASEFGSWPLRENGVFGFALSLALVFTVLGLWILAWEFLRKDS